MKIAIISGGDFDKITGVSLVDEIFQDTPWGETSSSIKILKIKNIEIFFLSRHGDPQRIPPHKINYRANIWALNKIDVKKIISINTVGGITQLMSPNEIIIPNQIIDYTYGRQSTYHEDNLTDVKHIDFTDPYTESLRKELINSAKRVKLNIHTKGTYGVTQGPRLETAAEISKLENDGCNIVGMTGLPEDSLAREIDIDYASCCLVVNWAAGKSVEPINTKIMKENLARGIKDIMLLLSDFISVNH